MFVKTPFLELSYSFIFILVSLTGSITALAQTITPIPMEKWHKRQQIEERLTAFGDDLMGESIDPHTGSISFETTDVSLPGNFNLPVAISRRRNQGTAYHEDVSYGFGDWELQVPRITAITAASTGWSQKKL